MAKKTNKTEKVTFLDIHSNFKNNLKSLKVFVRNLAPVVLKYDKAEVKKLEEMVGKLSNIIGLTQIELKNIKKKKSIQLTAEKIYELARELDKAKLIAPLNIDILLKSSFIMLISYLDFLFSDLIAYYYISYQDSLSNKSINLSLKELRNFGNIDDAVQYFVNREVECVLFNSLNDQLKHFEDNLKIDLCRKIINWEKINEAIERRNIIVHNNGIINKKYLKTVNIEIVKNDKTISKEGNKISIDLQYFMSIFNEILIAGLILIQSCWFKWNKDKIKLAEEEIIKDIYDLLFEEEWPLAEKLGLFARQLKVSNDNIRLIITFNYLQSLKWQNKQKELDKEIQCIDVSSLGPKFLLAFSAINSNKKEFYENIKNAVSVDRLTKNDLNEWPLFRERRNDSYFKKHINNIFSQLGKNK